MAAVQFTRSLLQSLDDASTSIQQAAGTDAQTAGVQRSAGDTRALRAGSVLLILAAGLLGSLPPLFMKAFRNHDGLASQVARSLAAGVILALGLVHIIPEAVEQMAGLGGVEYPLGGVCVVLGVALMLLLEHVSQILHSSQAAQAHGPCGHGHGQGHSSSSHGHSHSRNHSHKSRGSSNSNGSSHCAPLLGGAEEEEEDVEAALTAQEQDPDHHHTHEHSHDHGHDHSHDHIHNHSHDHSRSLKHGEGLSSHGDHDCVVVTGALDEEGKVAQVAVAVAAPAEKRCNGHAHAQHVHEQHVHEHRGGQQQQQHGRHQHQARQHLMQALPQSPQPRQLQAHQQQSPKHHHHTCVTYGNAPSLMALAGPGPKSAAQGAGSSLRLRMLAYMFELGCVFHSVIIGIAIGVIQDDPAQVRALVIALTFHQWLEGIGLGSVIVRGGFSTGKAVTMVLVYSLTCPIGIVIGMLIAQSYDANSTTARAVQGTFNGLSGGMLLYISLVQLVAEDMGRFVPGAKDSTSRRLLSFVALCGGAAAMCLLAVWT